MNDHFKTKNFFIFIKNLKKKVKNELELFI
jgi:hypothetical protein